MKRKMNQLKQANGCTSSQILTNPFIKIKSYGIKRMTVALMFVLVLVQSCKKSDLTIPSESAKTLNNCSFSIQTLMPDLIGNSSLLNYGNNVSISGDGNTIAVYGGAGNSNVAPFVDVFKIQNGAWVRVGQQLSVSAFKPTLAFSYDGQTLAISKTGEIEIYKLLGNVWTKQSGLSLSFMSSASIEFKMNKDANVILVADNAWNNNSGRIKIFELQGAAWVQRGLDITDAQSISLGTINHLSADGSGIITNISDYQFGPITSRAYKFVNGNWTPQGNDFSFTYSYSYSSNSNFTKIAITDGDIQNEKVNIYNFSNGGWNLESSITNIPQPGGGNYIARLTDDGNTIVILSYLSALGKDQIQVYKKCGNSWVEATNKADYLINASSTGIFIGATLDGFTLHVDANGTKLLSAAPGYNQNLGLVRLYELR